MKKIITVNDYDGESLVEFLNIYHPHKWNGYNDNGINKIAIDDVDDEALFDSNIANFDFDTLSLNISEEARIANITRDADVIIENKYSPLKQRKLMSIALALFDKKFANIALTQVEEDLLQETRDANAWITSIRVQENTAIANGTLPVDIVWIE